MSALEQAREFDSVDDSIAAARAYEDALQSGEKSLDVLLDLAVLYFTLLDPGEAAARSLGQDFLDQAWERANELLREAGTRFGTNSEIDFWSRYFEFIVLGAEPFVDDCRRLANADESLVPFFYLWSEAADEYRENAQALYKQVSSGSTARERYVRSIVESAADLA